MAKKQSVYLLAAGVLQGVIDRNQSIDHGIEQARAKIPPSQGALLQEISYGCCRQYSYLNAVVGLIVDKPIKSKNRLIHHLIITGLYQLIFMRTPDHAVVSNCVESAKQKWAPWAANLVNAVLRGFLRDQQAVLGKITDAAEKLAAPVELFELINADWPDQCESILIASNQRPPMTLRINRQKTDRNAYLQQLKSSGVSASATVDSVIGVTLEEPCAVGEVPGFEQGMVSVQDESAQFTADLLQLASGQKVLDGCAAPGGKTGLILEAPVSLSQLVAVDLPDRIEMIQQNLRRIQPSAECQIEVVAGSLLSDQVLLKPGFDRILLDVPCSGTGVIRRHPDIKHRRKISDISRFAEQQQAILQQAWSLLATGGKLLYITCSVLRAENDQVIQKFIEQHSDAQVDDLSQADSNLPGLAMKHGVQRLPGVHAGDGFYYSRLTRT